MFHMKNQFNYLSISIIKESIFQVNQNLLKKFFLNNLKVHNLLKLLKNPDKFGHMFYLNVEV